MTKKIITLILALVLIVSMSAACGGGNGGDSGAEAAPADNAADSGHEHVWTDATHEKAKTCSECGETEGEPLPHEWIPANYQEPKICELCGETEGEPIPPVFESLGFELSDIGVKYTYKSCYKEDMSDAKGEVTVKDVRITDGDEYFELKDGYEWVIASCLVECAPNPKMFQIGLERTDYYSYDLGTALTANVVNYYGVEYEVVSKTQILESIDTKMDFEIGFLVPNGYDGVILFFFNDYNSMVLDYDDPDLVVTYGDYIDGDTLFFRLK